MPPTRRSRDGLLARVNFPLYTVQMLTSRHVLVGGGGGSANTGVANGFEIFEISHDGNRFIAEEVIRYETGPTVVMNCSSYSNSKHTYLVAGQESHCQLYHVQDQIIEDKLDDEAESIETIGHKNGVRHRKKSTTKSDTNKNNLGTNKRLSFVIKSGDSVQTDFGKEEPIQRVVRICNSGQYMATGGTDGVIRLWKFPSLTPVFTIKGHKKEIDDIDFCPFQSYIATVAKDAKGILWHYKNGKTYKELSWNKPEGSTYMFKRCRFGRIEGKERESAVYTLANATGVAKKQKSYLQMWSTSGGLMKSAMFDENLAALAVRDDGRFVAVGTMFSGSVSIYVAFSLQRVLNISGAHSMFVTGLEFLPVVSDAYAITSKSEAAVVSISVDNQVCIHSLPYRNTIPLWLGILVIIISIFSAFVICSYLGI